MKKILSFLLVLACLIPCAFATGCGNKIKVDTKYYFKGCEIETTDQTLTQEEINSRKTQIEESMEGTYVIMYKDNTAKMFDAKGNVHQEMTYSVDKDNIKFTVDGEDTEGKIDGKKVKITFQAGDVKMTYIYER